MFDTEILSLARRGLTTGGIALHLGLSPQYVREVVSAEVTGREVKSVYIETQTSPLHAGMTKCRVAASKRDRRCAAENKRDKALRQLAELQAILGA